MNYRNKKILNLARDAPCVLCGSSDGTVVAAHSNQSRDGKSMSMKSNDYRVAYLCYHHHFMIDSGKLSREEKVEMWEDAHRKTIGWLFDNEHLEVK